MKNEDKTQDFFGDIYHDAPMENDYERTLSIQDCTGLVLTDPFGERCVIKHYEIRKDDGGDLKCYVVWDWDV